MKPVMDTAGTVEGALIKTDKAQWLHHIERKANPDAVQQPGDAAADVAVIDRNAVHQLLRKVPPSFFIHFFHQFQLFTL